MPLHRKPCATTSETLAMPPFRSQKQVAGGRRESLTMQRHRLRFGSYPAICFRDLRESFLRAVGINPSHKKKYPRPETVIRLVASQSRL